MTVLRDFSCNIIRLYEKLVDTWTAIRSLKVASGIKVGLKAIEEDIARVELSEEELRKKAGKIILRSRNHTKTLMDTGLIKTAHEVE